MKIAVVGSRNFKDKDFVEKTVCKVLQNGDTFVSGGARGVDSWAEDSIEILETGIHNFEIKRKIFKPEWDKYGKRAGFLRNKLIVDEADKVIAFWDGKSKGTKHSIDLAIQAGKPVDIYIRN